MVPAYGLRGSLGFNYLLTEAMSTGFYYQSRKRFTFEDGVLFPGGEVFDIKFDHPANLGLGIAHNGLMDGRLLLATDILYKVHSNANFLREIYSDQWVFQFGAQYVSTLACGFAWVTRTTRTRCATLRQLVLVA